MVESIDGLLPSPRAAHVRDISNWKNSSLTCCKFCGMLIQKKNLPVLVTNNNCCLGTAPECLTELTETELAFIAPVKHFGHCFLWTSGKCSEESMSFFE